MASYPSYNVGLDSTYAPENGYQDDFSSSGIQHSRLFHGSNYVRFSVIHPGLTGQQYTDLKQTYETYPRTALTGFAWHTSSPSITYNVTFLGPPQIVKSHGNNTYDVRVDLRGKEV